MIVFLEGMLEAKEPARAVVNVHGIGYEAAISINTYDALPPAGSPCRLQVVQIIREDAHLLFGFSSEEERQTFLLLTTVNGIGPKLAMAVLNGMSTRDLKTAIANGDVKRISGISGVGKKMAERLVLEMRGKLGKGELMEAAHGGPVDNRLRDAILALVSLGYKAGDAEKMVQGMAAQITSEDTVEEILRRIFAARS